MSFTVLRVEVQQWEDEEILLPVGGQSEEGVEADDVVEEEGNQEDCGHLWMRVDEPAMVSVFIFKAEGPRILLTLFIDPSQCITRVPVVIFTAWRWCVESDRQVHVGEYVCCRENNVEHHDGQDCGHLHLLEYDSLKINNKTIRSFQAFLKKCHKKY